MEEKAQLLGFSFVKAKAAALGFRLTAKRNVDSFDEYTSGEARSAQRGATTGYKLEAKEVVADKGRREDDRQKRDDRARRGGQDVAWVTVVGLDHSATLSEVADYLNQYQADAYIDDADIEIDDKKPKVAAPSLQKMAASLAGHDNAEEISRIGYGNKVPGRRPTEAVQRRRLAIEDIYATMQSPAFDKTPREHQMVLSQRLEELEREEEEYMRVMYNYDKTKDDPVRIEAQRQRNAFLKADRALFRTNKRSRWDIAANGTRPGFDRDHDWIECNMLPDPDAPDFQAPTPSIGFAIQTKKAAGQRDCGDVKGAALDSLREAARQRRLADTGPKIKALLAARDYAGATALLDKIKQDAGHGNFLVWLDQAGIDKQAAQRCMRRPKASPKIKL